MWPSIGDQLTWDHPSVVGRSVSLSSCPSSESQLSARSSLADGPLSVAGTPARPACVLPSVAGGPRVQASCPAVCYPARPASGDTCGEWSEWSLPASPSPCRLVSSCHQRARRHGADVTEAPSLPRARAYPALRYTFPVAWHTFPAVRYTFPAVPYTVPGLRHTFPARTRPPPRRPAPARPTQALSLVARGTSPAGKRAGRAGMTGRTGFCGRPSRLAPIPAHRQHVQQLLSITRSRPEPGIAAKLYARENLPSIVGNPASTVYTETLPSMSVKGCCLHKRNK